MKRVFAAREVIRVHEECSGLPGTDLRLNLSSITGPSRTKGSGLPTGGRGLHRRPRLRALVIASVFGVPKFHPHPGTLLKDGDFLRGPGEGLRGERGQRRPSPGVAAAAAGGSA
jgi:hypothetical protein